MKCVFAWYNIGKIILSLNLPIYKLTRSWLSLFLFGVGDLLEQDQTMWLFQIGIVVLKTFVNSEAASLVESEAHLVEHVHVEVDSGYV